MQAFQPSWSPDGGRITFVDMSPRKPLRIYLVAAAGGMPEPLFLEQHNQVHPTWSPDGKSVAFSYVYFLETARRGIMIMNLATHRAVRLPGSEGVWDAEWSPDGRYIAARTVDSHAIMLFDFRTRRWAELVKSDVGYMKWSPDARYVYFKRLGSQTAILRVRVGGYKVEEVVGLKDIKNTGLGGGLWIGVTPDNSPLLLHDTGTQEIYALDWHTR